jgi:cytochrome c oxidase subunit 2
MNWLPPNGALHGSAFDHLLGLNLAIVFWLFVVAQVLIVVALFRRASGSNDAKPGRALLIIDYAVLLAITGLYLWMVASSHRLWAASREQPSASSAVRDGIYGATQPTLVSAPTGNPLGLDPADPNSADDVVSSILMLPARQPVDLTLRAQDVIHGFFVPGMRLKQDAIPGMPGHLHFTPDAPGDYAILCSQVCGLGHYRMQARLRVVTPDQFNAWLASHERALAQ